MLILIVFDEHIMEDSICLSVTFVCDLFAQVINTMENSECCDGEDVSLTPDAADDSCITQFIEIVPLHISRNDFPNAVQVKDEFTADIKQEPEDLCEVYGSCLLYTSPSPRD